MRQAGIFAKVNKIVFTQQGNKFGVCDGDGNTALWQGMAPTIREKQCYYWYDRLPTPHPPTSTSRPTTRTRRTWCSRAGAPRSSPRRVTVRTGGTSPSGTPCCRPGRHASSHSGEPSILRFSQLTTSHNVDINIFAAAMRPELRLSFTPVSTISSSQLARRAT